MTLRPPLRLKDDPSVDAELRRQMGREPKSATLSMDYDVMAGIARFEAAIGIEQAAQPLGASEPTVGPERCGDVAASNPGMGGGLGTPVAVGTGLKGSLIFGAAIGACIVAAGVAGSHLLGLHEAGPSPASSLVAPIAAVSAGADASAAENGAAPSIVQDTDLELVEETKPTQASSLPAASAASRVAKPATGTAATRTVEAPPATSAVTGAPNPASGTRDFAAEMDHLTQLRAVRSSDPEATLRMAEQGDTRFPRGLFRQERGAIAIQALMRLNRLDEAKRRARAFKTAYPKSPFAQGMNQLLDDARD